MTKSSSNRVIKPVYRPLPRSKQTDSNIQTHSITSKLPSIDKSLRVKTQPGLTLTAPKHRLRIKTEQDDLRPHRRNKGKGSEQLWKISHQFQSQREYITLKDSGVLPLLVQFQKRQLQHQKPSIIWKKYAYQREGAPPHHEHPHFSSHMTRLRKIVRNRSPGRSRDVAETRSVNIDAYFDLSCLK